MLDPNRRIMRRWLSRQSNLGSVSLSYQLSDQPVFGEWIIKVIAQSQVEEKQIYVEEYYQTRFEVNVTMPAFFFENDLNIHGIIQANYTSGVPVRGNLTLKATIKPIDKYKLTTGAYDSIPERYLNFDERYPSWFNPPDLYRERVPVLRFFNGTYRFVVFFYRKSFIKILTSFSFYLGFSILCKIYYSTCQVAAMALKL